jgi:hypothetical protein
MQNWLGTCGKDLRISDSDVPCVENMILVAALCVPVFLVTVFDTGILFQVGVFLYGCANGLIVLGLGQVVTWNDLVKQFQKGAASFHFTLLSARIIFRTCSTTLVIDVENATVMSVLMAVVVTRMWL